MGDAVNMLMPMAFKRWRRDSEETLQESINDQVRAWWNHNLTNGQFDGMQEMTSAILETTIRQVVIPLSRLAEMVGTTDVKLSFYDKSIEHVVRLYVTWRE